MGRYKPHLPHNFLLKELVQFKYSTSHFLIFAWVIFKKYFLLLCYTAEFLFMYYCLCVLSEWLLVTVCHMIILRIRYSQYLTISPIKLGKTITWLHTKSLYVWYIYLFLLFYESPSKILQLICIMYCNYSSISRSHRWTERVPESGLWLCSQWNGSAHGGVGPEGWLNTL